MSLNLDPRFPTPFAANQPAGGFFNSFWSAYFEKLNNDHLPPGDYCEKAWKQQNGSAKMDELFMQKCVEQCLADRRFEHWSRFY